MDSEFLDSLYRAAAGFARQRDNMLKIPDTQKKLIQPDYEQAAKKLGGLIEEAIDNRIEAVLGYGPYPPLKKLGGIVRHGEKSPEEIVEPEDLKERPAPEATKGTSDADIFG